MGNSKNGSIVGQVIKGLFTLAIGIFAVKQGTDKWKEKNSNKS